MKHLFSLALLSILMFGAVQISRADTIIFTANLSGTAEAMPNNSPGIGTTIVTYDSALHTLRVQVTFSGLTGTTTAAHIHAPTMDPFTGAIGVATTLPTFAGFPSGVTSGTYDNTLDLMADSSYNPSFLTANGGAAGAETALIAALMQGRAYLNVHTTTFGGGEIRGFLVAVPEPTTMLLLATGLSGLAVKAYRKRRGY
ncbi:MAG TPA: CHRD domain-containing protein [Pyrinomonadaceae bacterium]|nr:CHRD domain-containing protein [Pyrinomonadaceae bacterium]